MCARSGFRTERGNSTLPIEVAEANLCQSMQQAVDPLGQRAADAGNARQIVDARRLYTAQAAEVSEQRAPSRGADAGDILQRRRRARFTATRAMALYRETVRFVANLLQQMQSRMIRGQFQRRIAIGKYDLFFTRPAL